MGGVSNWRKKLIAKRRQDVYNDYMELAAREPSINHSVLCAMVAVKYELSAPTVDSDVRFMREQLKKQGDGDREA